MIGGRATDNAVFRQLTSELRLPVVQAPMFLVSGPEMVIAAARAGIMGSFPTQNARTPEQLQQWLDTIRDGTTIEGNGIEGKRLPWAANIIVHPTYERRDADMELLARYRPTLVVTALGSPAHVIERVHGYGGLVFADVTNPRLARKAVEAGVDGLVLVCAGAGGHTGQLSPFAFVDTVREFWDGPLIVGGGIATGRDVRAVLALGADLAYLGTRFLATTESMVSEAYKRMVVDSSAEDIVCSDAITGVKANWLRASLIRAGYDPDNMPKPGRVNVAETIRGKRWKDIWAAGQSVGPVRAIEPLADVVDTLEREWLGLSPAVAPAAGTP